MEQPGSPQDAQNSQSAAQPQEDIFQESDYSMEGYDKHIRNARNMLFIVGGLQLIALFSIKNEEEPARTITIGIIVFVALVFAGLAFWTKRKPFAAILTALLFYAFLLILDGIFEPATIFQGLLLKIGVIIALIAGLRNAKEGEDLKKAFGKD